MAAPPRRASVTDIASLNEAVANTVATDPELRAAMRSMVFEAIKDMRVTLRTGTPQAKAPIHRALAPWLLRGMIQQEQQEAQQGIRETLDEMHAAVRGALIPAREVPARELPASTSTGG